MKTAQINLTPRSKVVPLLLALLTLWLFNGEAAAQNPIVDWNAISAATAPGGSQAGAPVKYVAFDIPGARLSCPLGVNASGEIVGLYRDASNRGHRFLLEQLGYLSIDYPGAAFTNAGGINGGGSFVGLWTDSGGKNHAYLRTPDGQFMQIDPPSPGVVTALPTVAHGINESGDIVGRCFDANGTEHRFLQHRDGTFEVFDYPGSLTTDTWMLTNRGEIVGDYTDGDGFVHGYLRTRDGQFTSLEFPDAPNTGELWIDEREDITGIYATADGITRGFLWRDGQFITVDFAAAVTGGLTINNNGLIAGGFVDPDGKEHRFVAIEPDDAIAYRVSTEPHARAEGT